MSKPSATKENNEINEEVKSVGGDYGRKKFLKKNMGEAIHGAKGNVEKQGATRIESWFAGLSTLAKPVLR